MAAEVYRYAVGSIAVMVLSDQSVVLSRHPDWHGWFDQDPIQAAAIRRRVYDMLASDRMPVQAYHHPFLGLGRVERDGSG
ncbi:MAG: MBL fold metallo-hydrolase, partial [Hyphomicrobiales bacterium]|nr:MBL fold metallo-hydrolase [Hyphomicrobiales bacterium]